MRNRILASVAAAVLLAAGAGCGDAGQDDGRLRVVAAFYPLEFLAERVGGAHVSVTGLAPPGVEAHDLELTPSQVAEISRADLVIYLPGFQPAVDDAVDQHANDAALRLVPNEIIAQTTTTGQPGPATSDHGDHDHDHDHGAGPDPHFWLDPTQLAVTGDQVAAALAELEPAHRADFTAGAAELGEQLTALDTSYADGLADCQRREIVVSHAAFGHLANRYGLTQIAITGLTPEAEPTPQRMATVIRETQTHQATTIFFETLVSPAVAEVIADHTGARTAVLDPIEGLPTEGDHDYVSLMHSNLDALRAGLGCR